MSKSGTGIREVVGIFVDADAMEAAIKDLKAASIEDRNIGLLTSEYAVKEHLGHAYQEVNRDEKTDTVQTAFVTRDSLGDTAHALLGTLYIMGTAIGGGAVVASAGILGGAVAAAAATTAVFSGLGVVMAVIAHESDVELLHEQVDEGHLLLFVRIHNSNEEQLALKIFDDHGDIESRIISVNANKKEKYHEGQR